MIAHKVTTRDCNPATLMYSSRRQRQIRVLCPNRIFPFNSGTGIGNIITVQESCAVGGQIGDCATIVDRGVTEHLCQQKGMNEVSHPRLLLFAVIKW